MPLGLRLSEGLCPTAQVLAGAAWAGTRARR
jgi:hypothetical protein